MKTLRNTHSPLLPQQQSVETGWRILRLWFRRSGSGFRSGFAGRTLTFRFPFASLSPLALLLALTFACLLPFVGKAFHIDDTLFLRVAEQIQKHPADFYGFRMNWYGVSRPMVENFDNPPLACYYLALAGWLGGWSEPVLHLAFLLPALAAAWGIFSLARFHTERPLLAGL